MKYFIAEASDADDLAAIVNAMINDGWQPNGGVAVSISEEGSYDYLFQAMIKNENK